MSAEHRRDSETLLDAPEVDGAPETRKSDVRTLRGELFDGHYELRSRIGEGASGTVYEAWDRRSQEAVAIKLLHTQLSASPIPVARFQREVRAMVRVDHPAIVRVLDAGEDPRGTLYLVMELLEGTVLSKRIEAGMATCDVLDFGVQLLGALAAAHDASVIHRDIKPDNLFLHDMPEGPALRVLDFGIAKTLRRDAPVTFQTMDGTLLGTPEYMSPEVCRGDDATEAADLWATAAVLYHAFTGAPPFVEDHVGRLLMRIVKDPAVSLGVHRPDLPRSVIAAVDRALRADPRERFTDARTFAAALA
ncbi:MAG: serine/threonine-protein kinase [Sandaracinaceae bacterium]